MEADGASDTQVKSTRLQEVTSQKTVIFIVTAMRTIKAVFTEYFNRLGRKIPR
jgi:hypothetical protein